jgi:transposase InsO family protein
MISANNGASGACGARRRGELADQVILHVDRGCQYTSVQLARFAREHNLVRSVGRKAVCSDNAQIQSFWATLKVEFYDRYSWPTEASQVWCKRWATKTPLVCVASLFDGGGIRRRQASLGAVSLGWLVGPGSAGSCNSWPGRRCHGMDQIAPPRVGRASTL